MKKIIKIILEIIPFKKNIFCVLKKFIKFKPNVYQHLHFKGIFKVSVINEASFKIKHYGYQVENDIFWSGLLGEWEKISLSIWIKLSKKSEVIFDIGANTGVYALVAKAVNRSAKIYALEPVKRVFDKLTYNNQLNNFDINCIQGAASNYDGFGKIYDTNTEHTYSVTVNKNLNNIDSNFNITEIETIKLDTIIKNKNIQKIDLIKIDVETHEPEVLEGYKEFIFIHKPSILIEVLSDEIGIKIQSIITLLNYLYFNIDEKTGIKKVDKIIKSDYYNYLLCDESTAKYLNLV